jgi:diacylglycerol kinase (ATP)
MSSILYIINPAGHGGSGIKAWERFQALWPDKIPNENAIVTKRPGHAREISAFTEDYDILAAVGGDGTVGEVMSGIMDRQGQKPKLAVIPAGTGNDIARHAGICSVEDAVGALQGNHPQAFDIIRADYQADGKPGHSYAFLLVGVGFSANVMIRPWMKRFLGPKGAYYLATFLQIIVYRPPLLTVRADGRERSKSTSWMVMVGNVEYSSGGSMCIAPGARCDDGELNVTVFPVKSKFRMSTKLLPKVATGAHIEEPGVSYFPAKNIEIDSAPPAILDLDGDILGTTPATLTVCPGAMHIMTPETRAKGNVQPEDALDKL